MDYFSRLVNWLFRARTDYKVGNVVVTFGGDIYEITAVRSRFNIYPVVGRGFEAGDELTWTVDGELDILSRVWNNDISFFGNIKGHFRK